MMTTATFDTKPGHTQETSTQIDINSDMTWNELYPSLRSLARYLVNTLPLGSWRGQEADIVEDIVQETMRRVIERSRKAERGEATPIQSLKQMITVIAYNYYRDMRRHDHRLTRIDACDYMPVTVENMESAALLLDSVTERVYQESLFDLLAGEIEHFPRKQRSALLTDLANRMCFDARPTPLQEAFLEVGIELQHYKHPLPEDPKERSRHVSLLSQAYKRVAHLSSLQEYIAEYDGEDGYQVAG